jgi:hypothetical protein
LKTLLLSTLKLSLFAIAKIPLIFFLGPKIIKLNDETCEAVIPLTYRSRNHLHSQYFGALAVGADLCIGLIATHHIKKSHKKISLVFKDFTADFKKLAKADVHFHCLEGGKIETLVDKVIATGTRQNATIRGFATTPKVSGDEIIMNFSLTLSLK